MHVLVAIDSSAAARACVDEVASRPWSADTRVRVLSVTGIHPAAPLPQPGMPYATAMRVPPPGTTSLDIQERATETARRVAQEGADVLARSGLHALARIREGTPGTQIVEEASEWAADLFIVGSRGRSVLKRVFLGSVSRYVVHHAPCSVEVVREKATA